MTGDNSPDRTAWSDHLLFAGVALTFLAVLAATARFGIADVSGALTFSGRFTGFLLLIAAIIVIVGLWAIWDRWYGPAGKVSGVIGLIACLASVIVSSMFLATAYIDGDVIYYRVGWPVLLLASLWTLYLIYKREKGTEKEGAVGTLSDPNKVGLAVAISTLLAVANFGYSQLYQPYVRSTNVSLEAKFGNLYYNAQTDGVVVPVDITVDNKSSLDVNLAFGQYILYGLKEVRRQEQRSVEDRQISVSKGWDDMRYALQLNESTVASGAFIDDTGTWLNAGQSWHTARLVDIPASAPLQDLELSASMIVGRKDRATIGRAVEYDSWKGRSSRVLSGCTKHCIAYQARVRENNAISAAQRHVRYLTIWQPLFSGDPFLWTVSRQGKELARLTPREEERIIQKYGLYQVSSGQAAVSLQDFLQQTRRA